jgi:hypothetical protein
MTLGVGLYSSFEEQHAAHRRAGCPTCLAEARADAPLDRNDFVAQAQHIREQHDATHGEAEQCGVECIVMGLADFDDYEARADALDVARLVRTVEEVQSKLTESVAWAYDADSWEIFVGNQMQQILDAITADDRRRSAETLDHAIHDATGYDPDAA